MKWWDSRLDDPILRIFADEEDDEKQTGQDDHGLQQSNRVPRFMSMSFPPSSQRNG